MANQGFVTLSLVVLLALFEVGSCIRCYQCNTQQDAKCADPYSANPKFLVDCTTQDSVNYNQLYLRSILPSEYTSSITGASRYCHKIVMKSGTIIRTCLDGNPTNLNQTCQSLDTSSKLPTTADINKIAFCGACDKDSCNGASSISFSFPLASLVLIATYLFCKQ